MPNSPPEIGIVIRTVHRQDGWFGFLRVKEETLFFHQRQRRTPRCESGTLRWIHPHGVVNPPQTGTRVAFLRSEVYGETRVFAWTLAEQYEAALANSDGE